MPATRRDRRLDPPPRTVSPNRTGPTRPGRRSVRRRSSGSRKPLVTQDKLSRLPVDWNVPSLSSSRSPTCVQPVVRPSLNVSEKHVTTVPQLARSDSTFTSIPSRWTACTCATSTPASSGSIRSMSRPPSFLRIAPEGRHRRPPAGWRMGRRHDRRNSLRLLRRGLAWVLDDRARCAGRSPRAITAPVVRPRVRGCRQRAALRSARRARDVCWGATGQRSSPASALRRAGLAWVSSVWRFFAWIFSLPLRPV